MSACWVAAPLQVAQKPLLALGVFLFPLQAGQQVHGGHPQYMRSVLLWVLLRLSSQQALFFLFLGGWVGGSKGAVKSLHFWGLSLLFAVIAFA